MLQKKEKMPQKKLLKLILNVTILLIVILTSCGVGYFLGTYAFLKFPKPPRDLVYLYQGHAIPIPKGVFNKYDGKYWMTKEEFFSRQLDHLIKQKEKHKEL